jgi:Skp family chaperone for outer membrane proteins
MKKLTAILLSLVLIYPPSLAAVTGTPVIKDARQLTEKSYLDLLEMDRIPQFSPAEIKTVDDQLKKERESEQARLKKEQDRLEKDLKTARKRLDELNKKESRDSAETSAQRTEIHCEVLRLEDDLAKTKTEREKGVPIIFQNKFAKLDLIQKWPAIRLGIEERIKSGRARDRRYGDVEDIGVRDLGIEDLAEKQHQDIKMGEDAIREMKTQRLMPPEIEDKEVNRYIQNLANAITGNSDLKVPIKVTVLDSMEINAFALPGGFLFVNLGLINKAETESELVGVLAHETAHAAARHAARLMKRATIADIVFQAAQIGAIIFTGGVVGAGTYYALQYGFYGLGMILDLTLLGVSRDYEAEADQLGAQYAWKAGYDPKGFITFFDKMASEEGYARSASFFRTHPPFLERIISTFSEITYLPTKQDLRMDSSAFIKVKERVSDLIKVREAEQKTRPTLRGKAAECPPRKPISN